MNRLWLVLVLATASAPLLAEPLRASAPECSQQANADETDTTAPSHSTTPGTIPAPRVRKPSRVSSGGGTTTERTLPLPHAQSFLPGMFR